MDSTRSVSHVGDAELAQTLGTQKSFGRCNKTLVSNAQVVAVSDTGLEDAQEREVRERVTRQPAQYEQVYRSELLDDGSPEQRRLGVYDTGTLRCLEVEVQQRVGLLRPPGLPQETRLEFVKAALGVSQAETEFHLRVLGSHRQ